MTDRPLFAPALSGLTFSAHWEHPDGWVLVVGRHYEGERSWRPTERYDHLSTQEMVDVCEAILEGLDAERWRSGGR